MSRKICNWSEYNNSLINRGSITFWISEDVIRTWKPLVQHHKAGRPEEYSDPAIKALCMLRFYFHLTLRGVQGFIRSLFSLMNLPLKTPSYSRICRRMKELNIDYKRLSQIRPVDLVIDSTGVKIYGAGEWHVKIHGENRRKKWKKITLGVCPKTHEILFNIPSDDSIGDSPLFREALEYVPRTVKEVIMDGAADSYDTYMEAERRGIRLITPPRKGAKYRIGSSRCDRDQHVKQIYQWGNNPEARKRWKREKGYHRRSLVETCIGRLKGMLGDQLKSHRLVNQYQEILLKSMIINKLNNLGLPKRI